MAKFYVTLKVEVERLVLVEADCEEDAAEYAKEGKGEIEDQSEGAVEAEFVEGAE